MLNICEIFDKGLPFDGHYKLIDLLSTAGGSADVWLAIDLNTIDESGDESMATRVVIKIYRPKNMIDIEGEYQFRKEFKKVFGCHHENIIQPTYFSVFEGHPYLVLPYCPSGSSERLVGQLKDKDDIWKFIFQVSSGLAYLHELTPQIIHQDIKPANILIDGNGNFAITDFGISAEMGGTSFESEDESGGTLAYMAPERFADDTPPMPESDIWALGATIYELITGDAPYGNDGGIRQKKGECPPAIKQDLPDSIKELIFTCLSYDAKQRPTARRIVDTVLRKRYSRNKKVIAVAVLIVIVLAAGISLYLTDRHSALLEDNLDSLYAGADSIVTSQVMTMGSDNCVPTSENISEFRKAIVLFNKVVKDSPDSYSKKMMADSKVRAINELILKIEEYEYIGRLVENARLTEMDDSATKYSLILETEKLHINQLIQQLR